MSKRISSKSADKTQAAFAFLTHFAPESLEGDNTITIKITVTPVRTTPAKASRAATPARKRARKTARKTAR